MRLIITRHGQTTDNSKKIIQGSLPGQLSEHGKKQATILGRRLSKYRIDIIFSSDLKRSSDTAKIIKKSVDSDLVYTKSLREIHMGDYEGKSRPWNNYEEMGGFISKNKMNGESVEDLYKRAKEFIEFLIQNYPKKTVLLVGHTAINQALISAIGNQGLKGIFEQEKQNNTAVNVFEMTSGKVEVKARNCTKHLS